MKDAKLGGSLGLFRRVSVKFGLGGVSRGKEGLIRREKGGTNR